jgi:hypothetical protein
MTKRPKNEDKKPGLPTRALGEAADNFGKEVAPLGRELGVVAVKVGRLLISGIDKSVYGVERVAEWMRDEVAKRLEGRPNEKIVEPNPRISVPATQALIYSIGEDHIRDMFANLLAADMDADKKENVHPAFVELIKEMTSREARVLAYIRDNRPQVLFEVRGGTYGKFQTLGTSYSIAIEGIAGRQLTLCISNLERLGLLTINESTTPVGEQYDAIEVGVLEEFKDMKDGYVAEGGDIFAKRKGIYMTALGTNFTNICLAPLPQ